MSSTEHISHIKNSERRTGFVLAGCAVGWFALLLGLTAVIG